MPERPRPQTQFPLWGNDRVLVPLNWSSAVIFQKAESQRASLLQSYCVVFPHGERVCLSLALQEGETHFLFSFLPPTPLAPICIGTSRCRRINSGAGDWRNAFLHRLVCGNENRRGDSWGFLYLYENINVSHHHFTKTHEVNRQCFQCKWILDAVVRSTGDENDVERCTPRANWSPGVHGNQAANTRKTPRVKRRVVLLKGKN